MNRLMMERRKVESALVSESRHLEPLQVRESRTGNGGVLRNIQVTLQPFEAGADRPQPLGA
jgi:hypothetical protein